MSESDKTWKFELECLRMAANCMNMAADVSDPALQSHLVQMGKLWPILAERGMDAEVPAGFHVDPARAILIPATRH